MFCGGGIVTYLHRQDRSQSDQWVPVFFVIVKSIILSPTVAGTVPANIYMTTIKIYIY